MWEEKNPADNVTTGDWKQPSEELICTLHSWQRARLSGICRWLGQGVSEVNVGLSKSLSWVKLSLGISGEEDRGRIEHGKGAISRSHSIGQGRTMIP